MWFVYILKCKDGSLYTGMTNDLERRFSEHKEGKGGHYTASRQAVKILYFEQLATRSEALKREVQIKKLRREKKIALIRSVK